MRALAYLEWRYAVHQFAAILRSPLRLAIWIPYALSVGYLAYLRFTTQHHTAMLSVSVQQPRFATVIAGLYLGTLGITSGVAAAGRVAAFRSSAEGVLLSNAGVRPLSVALWLQLRKLAMGSLRWFASLAYLFVLAAPRHASGGAALRALVGALLAVGLLMTCELPAFLLARRIRFPIQIIAWSVAAFGLAYALAGALGQRFLGPLVATLHVDPGSFATALLMGRIAPALILAALLTVLVASMLLLGNDALPELYAVTQRTLAIRNRRRRLTNETTFQADGARRVARIPAGAPALIWKDWVAFRRGRGAVRLWLVGATFWGACGAGVAYAAMRWDDPSPLFSLAGMSATLLLISAPLGASVGLAADLSKPIFWLSRAPLRARLAAWTFARSWRGGSAIALAPLVAGLVAGSPALAIGALPLSLASYWSLQALGVGLYAIFPDPVDGRGPMMLLRMLLTGVYVLPACAAALLVSALEMHPLIAVLAFVLVLGLEGWLVIEATTYRFREYGASLATLSRAT